MRSNRAFSLLILVVTACGPSGAGRDDDGQQPSGDGGTDPCAGGRCENACPADSPTTVSGRVLAPNGVDPIPFAQVYVPAEVRPIPEGVACELCSAIEGNALVRTTTGIDGSFTLGPIPSVEDQAPGAEIDLVVQKGRFRKVSKVAIDAPCAANALDEAATTLPSRTDGLDNIPRIAVATGDYDVMECVLRDLGIAEDGFDLYNGMADSIFGEATPGARGDLDALLGDLDRMKEYDIIFINCAADTFEAELANTAIKGNLEAYAAAGGRLYVTDWSYDYVEQVPEFAGVIDFEPSDSGGEPEARDAAAVGTGGIEVEAAVEDEGLASWLEAVEEVTGDELISDAGKVYVEHFFGGWVEQRSVPEAETSKVWLRGEADGLDRPLTTTFDYNECGRVLYSSYHTAGRGPPDVFAEDPFRFPNYCSQEGLTPQERVLLFLILHVADCIDDVIE